MKSLIIILLSTSLFCSEASKPAYQDDTHQEDYKEHRKKFKGVLTEFMDLYSEVNQDQKDANLFMTLLTLNDFAEFPEE